MATVIFPTDLQQYTGGVERTEVAAGNYRQLVKELAERFPALTTDVIQNRALAIDGAVIPTPMLETFNEDSELVFFGWMQGG